MRARPGARREHAGRGGHLRRRVAGEKIRRHEVGLYAPGSVKRGEARAVRAAGQPDRDVVVGLREQRRQRGAVAVVHPRHRHEAVAVDREVEPLIDLLHQLRRDLRPGRDPAVVLHGGHLRQRGRGAVVVQEIRLDPVARVVGVDLGRAGQQTRGVAEEKLPDHRGVAVGPGVGPLVDEGLARERVVRRVGQVVVRPAEERRLDQAEHAGRRRHVREGRREPVRAHALQPVRRDAGQNDQGDNDDDKSTQGSAGKGRHGGNFDF